MAYSRTPTLLDKEKAELVGPILNRLLLSIEREINQEPHPGLIIARHDFFEPYPTCSQIDLLSLSAMQLLIKFAYPALSGYAKFTVVLTRKLSSGAEVTFTIGPPFLWTLSMIELKTTGGPPAFLSVSYPSTDSFTKFLKNGLVLVFPTGVELLAS